MKESDYFSLTFLFPDVLILKNIYPHLLGVCAILILLPLL